MSAKVFLSFLPEDSAPAEQIMKIFEELSLEVVSSGTNRDAGEKYIEQTKKSLNTCSYFIGILSEPSLNSDEILFEINAAIGTGMQILLFLTNQKLSLPGYLAKYPRLTDFQALSAYFAQLALLQTHATKPFDPGQIENGKVGLDFQLPSVLLVDDESVVLKIIGELLTEAGFHVLSTSSRKKAQELWIKDKNLSMALIDLRMKDDLEPAADPQKTGFRIIRDLKNHSVQTANLGVIAAFSAYSDHANLKEAVESGCDAFISKSWSPQKIINSVKQLQQKADKSRAFVAFNNTLSRRSPYTAGHCERVVQLCKKIICYFPTLDGDAFDLGACLTAAEIHDIGKISLPDQILLGTQVRLTKEEKQLIQQHVEISNILNPIGDFFHKITEIIRYHHLFYSSPEEENLADYPEKTLDGKPAPRGKNIPIESRIIKVADVADAILSDRLYSPGRTVAQLKKIIQSGIDSGQFDPEVAKAFLNFLSIDNIELEIDSILKTGIIEKTHALDLYYETKTLTMGILQRIIEFISDIYLEDGRAIDRVYLDAGPVMIHHKKLLCFTVIGSKQDISSLYKKLKQRMTDNEEVKNWNNSRLSGFAEMDIMAFFIRRSIPVEIAFRLRDSNEVIYSYDSLKGL